MMIDDEDAATESAVEVTLPDDSSITEVKLDDKKAEIREQQPKVEARREEAPSEPVVDDREKALIDLKRQYERQKAVAEAEKEARKRAEEYARQQAYTANNAYNQVQDGNLRVILNAIDTTEQAAANAERDYADAMAAGDYAAAAKAQRLMAQAESHLLQLNNGKAKLEEQLQQLSEGSVKGPEIPSFEPQVPLDPVEAYASRLTPKSADWLRSHPEVVNKISRLSRAHEDAIEDGIVAESPEYFRFIESRLGYSNNASYDESPSEPAPSPREAPSLRKSVASAPVSSSSTSISPRSSSPNVMTLTPSEVEVALLMEPELSREKAIESYARNKATLIKQGKLSA